MKFDRVIALRNDRTVYRDGDRCYKVYAAAYPGSAVLREALNVTRAREVGLPVPAVREVTLSHEPVLVTDYLAGRMPDDIEGLIDLQLRVETAPADGFPPIKAVLRDRLPAAMHPALDALPDGDALCHGDLVPENLLCTADGEVFLLDWADAARGPAEADAALTYARLRRTDRARAEAYLARYTARTGMARDTIAAWLPILDAAYGLA